MVQARRAIFAGLRKLLVELTGHGDDRSPRINDLHHKLSYRLFKLAPALGVRREEVIQISAPAAFSITYNARDGGVGHKFLVYGEYEPFTSQVVGALLSPGQHVWNVGANLGYYSILASTLVGESGRVSAFEPHPANLAMLRKNIALNFVNNITVQPIAVSDANGEISFFESESNSGDHRITSAEGRSAIRVQAMAGSAALERCGLPDVLIMDVQGAEGRVLRSLKRALRSPGFAMLIEFWPQGLKESGSSAEEIEGLLGWLDYKVWRVNEARRRLEAVAPGNIAKAMRPGEEANLLCLPANFAVPPALAKLMGVH